MPLDYAADASCPCVDATQVAPKELAQAALPSAIQFAQGHYHGQALLNVTPYLHGSG